MGGGEGGRGKHTRVPASRGERRRLVDSRGERNREGEMHMLDKMGWAGREEGEAEVDADEEDEGKESGGLGSPPPPSLPVIEVAE